MRNKGLSDLRTATTARIHAKPPQKGAEYLNLYLLDKEGQRLEQELAGLEHRQSRILAHMAEIRQAMARVQEGALNEHIPVSQAAPLGASIEKGNRRQQWKKISVDY